MAKDDSRTPRRAAAPSPKPGSSGSSGMVLRSACKGHDNSDDGAVDSQVSEEARNDKEVHHHSVIESNHAKQHEQIHRSFQQQQEQHHHHHHTHNHTCASHSQRHSESIIRRITTTTTNTSSSSSSTNRKNVRHAATRPVESVRTSTNVLLPLGDVSHSASSEITAAATSAEARVEENALTSLSRFCASDIKTDYTYSQRLLPDPICPPNMSRQTMSSRSSAGSSLGSTRLANGLMETVHEESVVNGRHTHVGYSDQTTVAAVSRNGRRTDHFQNYASPELQQNLAENLTNDRLYGLDYVSDSEEEEQQQDFRTTTHRTKSSHRSFFSSFFYKITDIVTQKVWNVCYQLMYYIYWIVAYSLLFETWLMIREQPTVTRGRKSCWSWWLILIPLLLLLGGYSTYHQNVSDELFLDQISGVPTMGGLPAYTVQLPNLDSLDPSSSVRFALGLFGAFIGNMTSSIWEYFAFRDTFATDQTDVSGALYQSDNVGAAGGGRQHNLAANIAVGQAGAYVDQPDLRDFIRKMVREEVDTLSSRLTVARRDDVAQLQLTQDARVATLHDEIVLNARGVQNLKDDLVAVKLELQQQKQAATDDSSGARLQKMEGLLLGLQDRLHHLESELSRATEQREATTEEDTSGARLQKMEDVLIGLQDKLIHLETEQSRLLGSFRNCCKNHTEYGLFVQEHIISFLNKMSDAEKDGSSSPFLGFRQWLHSLKDSSGQPDQKDINTWANLIFSKISEDIKLDVESVAKSAASITAAEHVKTFETAGASSWTDLSESMVRSIVKDALALYSADKVAKTDFALESSGGSVISTRCSETYYLKTAQLSVLGFPLWYTTNTARIVIQPSVYPGECWAFKGSEGYVVIQLSVPIRPTGFTLEHIPRSLSPKGRIDSAPKEFLVFGLANEQDPEAKLLGRYTFLDDGEPLQQFSVTEPNDSAFPIVELRILSNHGNADYTCVYRFRVHGVPNL